MMKRVIVFLFFIPGFLLASDYCDYFEMNSNGDIAIKADKQDLVINLCDPDNSFSGITSINNFCDSLVISDECINVVGEYQESVKVSCFQKKEEAIVVDSGGSYGNWFVDFLVEVGKAQADMPYCWRR